MNYRDQKTKRISFPLGGIGTGCIGLAGNGALIDWEIYNRPNKNSYQGYSHFAIKVTDGERTVAKVLQGDTHESLMGMHDYAGGHIGFGYGPHTNSLAGFPHFRHVEFHGTFPLASVLFSEEDLPVTVRLNAFNPFIPHDEFNSGLPAAFFAWEVENLTERALECAVSFSVQNPADRSRNEAITAEGFAGISFRHAGKAENEIGYCDLCALTDCADAVPQAYWYRGGWQDAGTTYWRNFCDASRMPLRNYEEAGKRDHGSLVAYVKLAPRGRERVRFVLAWNVPNQYNDWSPCKDENGNDVTWKNYYATQFADSKASAAYAMRNFSELYEKTARFSDALQAGSMPEAVIDAVSANLSVLKTPTVLRYEDGSLWAWEGCSERSGSCEGSCQHVWNYAYALPFLFPRLERSLRENTLKYALEESGETRFRIPLPLGRKPGQFRSCVDGQMGEVIKCYREWKISGDDAWLRRHADGIFRMLEFAWSPENPDRWDADRDGVMEGRQHHTLDMELFGPSSWLQGFYLLALDCGAKIADAVGDGARAREYRELYRKGREWTNAHLFNGQYFCQKVDLKDRGTVDAFGAVNYWNEEAEEIKYQVADGCIIDQMLSDWHAVLIGGVGVFDADKKRTALESLYRYNYKPSLREVANMWRNFALNDESGTVICSYPEGARLPAIPIPYCEECMTGFEYALAGLMIANGLIREGETMVKAIRDRYDGEKRNPWNELECGSNYARSMASYALMPIYSGFSYDMTEKYIGFAPAVSGEGQYVWSVGNTWGTVKLGAGAHTLTVCGEPLTLASYGLPQGQKVRAIKADGREIDFRMEGDRAVFAPMEIRSALEIEL